MYAQEYMCEWIDSGTSAFASEMIEMALTDNFERFI